MSLETAIKKAIANEWKDEKIPENSQFCFRGVVQVELDITVKRPEDIEVTPKVDLIPLTVNILAVLARKAKVEPHQIENFLLTVHNESVKSKDELVRYSDAIDATLLIIKEDIQENLGKTKKAGATSVKGVIRLGKLVPAKS